MKYIIYLSLFFLTSCGKSHYNNQNKEDHHLNKDPTIEQLRTYILKYRRCSYKNTCKFQKLAFKPAKNNNNSPQQNILILDNEKKPAFVSSFFRHQDRVLAYLKQSTRRHGLYQEHRPLIKAPEILGEIFANVHHSVFASNTDLTYEVLKMHHKAKFIRPRKPDIAHGEYIFLILANFIPQARFVIAPFPEISAETFCSMNDQWENIIEYYDRSYQSLQSVLDKYHIQNVNISYSTDINRLRQHNHRLCNNMVDDENLFKLLEIKSTFLDKLSHNNPNKTFFTATPNKMPTHIANNTKGHSFSCKKRGNFIRVGFWNQYSHNLPAIGRHVTPRMLPQDQKNLIHCGDVFINGGIDESKIDPSVLHLNPFKKYIPKSKKWWSKDSLHIPYHGIYRYPIRTMSTSWATPVALALSFYIKEKYRKLLGQPLPFDTLQMSIQSKLFDPIKHKQLPKFIEKKEQIR